MIKKIILAIVIIGVVLFVAIQLVPYGHDHTNPAVSGEPQWDSPQTRTLAQRACFDCHSNQTVWPWYSNIAPISWLVYVDVAKGRSKLNFSEWDKPQEDKADAPLLAKALINSGRMPPSQYLLLHPTAHLTADEKQALITGFANSLK